MKRSILIEGLDKELVLSKVTTIRTDSEMIHLDKLKDGTWRIIYNESLIPDFKDVVSFKIIREDDIVNVSDVVTRKNLEDI